MGLIKNKKKRKMYITKINNMKEEVKYYNQLEYNYRGSPSDYDGKYIFEEMKKKRIATLLEKIKIMRIKIEQ